MLALKFLAPGVKKPLVMIFAHFIFFLGFGYAFEDTLHNHQTLIYFLLQFLCAIIS